MSLYPSMSWKNNSTHINDLAGVATYIIPKPGDNQEHLPLELELRLPDFSLALQVYDALEQAFRTGKAEAQATLKHAVWVALNSVK